MTDFQPLASRMRPQKLAEFVGQTHLVAPGKPLHDAGLHSMILWGPPGTGKTTLAKLLAARAEARVESISAVLAGVKDIRAVVERAKFSEQKTVLFVDEIHRFNKSQQDAMLPHVEDGTVTLIGATTENPSFELNNALLSRARVYVLKRLTHEDIAQIVDQALADNVRGLGKKQLVFPSKLRDQLVQFSDGDARQALNLLEVVADFSEDGEVTEAILKEVLTNGLRHFDKYGEHFYDQISALHKSIRGSSPDAALYWFCRIIDGGCDPEYVARRIIRAASEDIGNADPRALRMTLDAWDTYTRLGSPEGELVIAQAVIYLACAPKSNATYTAYKAAMRDVKAQGTLPVPLHLRNAPTALMKELDYGKDYRYAHNEADAYAAGETYFPDEMEPGHYYHPVDRGLEIKIREKLARLRNLDKQK